MCDPRGARGAAAVDFADFMDPPQPRAAQGRRDVGGESHMRDTAISAPVPLRHGRGRRHIEDTDHFVEQPELPLEDDLWGAHPRGRRHHDIQDELRDGLNFNGAGAVPRPMGPADVKLAIQELLTGVYNMSIADERRWADVAVEQHGIFWKILAMNDQRRYIGREGQNARAIAEKMSMSPVSELRYFGVRFGNGDRQDPQAMRPQRRSLGFAAEDNPTYVSPGVQTALGAEDPRIAQLSKSRREPEEMSRRYIRSGQDHWAGFEVASHGEMGQAKDMGFVDGIERCVGHGRRRIVQECHLTGVAARPQAAA